MLSKEEIVRYNRHLILPGFGKEAQEKLKKASVLVIGAGGLGCPVLQYLTAVGIGEIGIVDFDTIDESNLQRQVLYSMEDVGQSKAVMAANKLKLQNPNVLFRVFNTRLSTENALTLIDQFDLVIDGTDNFSTRYLVNDACEILEKPLVYGSIYKFEGQVSVFNWKNKQGVLGPNYRCLFPKPPEAGTVPNCSEIGVLGVLPGIIGTLQATEAIKVITEIGEPLSGKLLMFDALQMRFSQIEFERKNDCCKNIPSSIQKFQATDYDLMCGVSSSSKKTNSITVTELDNMIKSGKEFELLDVRDYDELPVVEELGGIHIPLSELEKSFHKIPRKKMIVVYCRGGMRSRKAIQLLDKQFGFQNLYNLEGGVMEWLNQFQKK